MAGKLVSVEGSGLVVAWVVGESGTFGTVSAGARSPPAIVPCCWGGGGDESVRGRGDSGRNQFVIGTTPGEKGELALRTRARGMARGDVGLQGLPMTTVAAADGFP